jgi:hypothetical protein
MSNKSQARYVESQIYQEYAKEMIEQGDVESVFRLSPRIKSISVKMDFLSFLGAKLDYDVISMLLKSFSSPQDESALLSGYTMKVARSPSTISGLFSYLVNHTESGIYLISILKYKARIECFFEQERNEEKLDMLSEVLDIEDWRRISSSLNNN